MCVVNYLGYCISRQFRDYSTCIHLGATGQQPVELRLAALALAYVHTELVYELISTYDLQD